MQQALIPIIVIAVLFVAFAVLRLNELLLTELSVEPDAAQSLFSFRKGVPFGGALVISMDAEELKYNTTVVFLAHSKVFDEMHAPIIQRIKGISGLSINLHRYVESGKLTKHAYNTIVSQHKVEGHLTYGALGCLESHVRAWHAVVQHNTSMLILEAHIRLTEEFNRLLPAVLDALPHSFGLLYFGTAMGDQIVHEYNSLLWRLTGEHWGKYAYLISPGAARIFLEHIYPVYAQVDHEMIDVAKKFNVEVYMTKHTLFEPEKQNKQESPVQRFSTPPLSIPKIFHFIWFSASGKPMSDAYARNVRLWSQLHPDWEIRLWNESNVPMLQNQARFIQATSMAQKSDIARFELVLAHGGIYLDVDFEPLKPIDQLLYGIDAFVAYESPNFICSGAFGATPGHVLTRTLVSDLSGHWENNKDRPINHQTGPIFVTETVKKLGLTMEQKFQAFARHVWFPYSYAERNLPRPTGYNANSFAVHHFGGHWQ